MSFLRPPPIALLAQVRAKGAMVHIFVVHRCAKGAYWGVDFSRDLGWGVILLSEKFSFIDMEMKHSGGFWRIKIVYFLSKLYVRLLTSFHH